MKTFTNAIGLGVVCGYIFVVLILTIEGVTIPTPLHVIGLMGAILFSKS